MLPHRETQGITLWKYPHIHCFLVICSSIDLKLEIYDKIVKLNQEENKKTFVLHEEMEPKYILKQLLMLTTHK